jgi:hypothetical protein
LDPSVAGVNFGRDFHYFGLKWSADSLAFYCDGKQMRSVKNDFCFSPAPVYLSEAIISWAGTVTDAIDGTQMEVDYVRIYDPTTPSATPTEQLLNGGFEVTTAGSINWEMTRDLLNYTSYSWLKTDPGDKLVSLRVKSESSSNPFAAILGQKVALDKGEYLLRFKARSSAVLPADNKFVFKFSNMYTDKTMFMNDSTPRVVIPTPEWKSYSYKLNLKEDYSGKITFGFGNLGTFDLDSISLVRLGDAVVSAVHAPATNKVEVYGANGKLVIKSETSQHIEVYNLDGSMLVSTQVPEGESYITLKRSGILLVRLRNKDGVATKKVLISFDKKI